MSSNISPNQMDEDEIPVLLEDQNKISKFSCLDFRRKDRLSQAVALKEEVQRLKDAAEEATLCMEPEGLLLKVGEVFVCGLDEMEISEYCEEQQRSTADKLESVENEINGILSEMEELKAALYAKFGSKRINLEFD